jgi:hypothetical protein
MLTATPMTSERSVPGELKALGAGEGEPADSASSMSAPPATTIGDGVQRLRLRSGDLSLASASSTSASTTAVSLSLNGTTSPFRRTVGYHAGQTKRPVGQSFIRSV